MLNRKRIALLLTAVLMLTTLVPLSVSAQDSGLTGQLEIFSWWSGDEGPALEALLALYSEQNPNVEVINATVTGGSGVNARAVLKTRMLGGDPPDSFQVHAGQELIGTWVVADRMEDLTPLFEEEGWFDVFPEGLIDLLSYEGGIYSVPVNIHRSNVMWYNPAKLEEWGVAAPTTWDEFFAICPTLQAAGVTPLVAGEAWTVNHLWESVALGVLGADGWNALWSGDLDPTGPELVAVWDAFNNIIECSNIGDDSASLSWQQATDRIVDGTAAFNIMGDWAAGYLTTVLGLTPGEGYGWSASPDTGGVFMMLSDSFGLPKDAPNSDNVIAWLKLLGSVAGQDAFNSLKGSIPARTDANTGDTELYNAYLQSAAADWSTDVIVGSLAHGAAANERFMNDFNSVMEIFLSSGDSQASANALGVVCLQSGACG